MSCKLRIAVTTMILITKSLSHYVYAETTTDTELENELKFLAAERQTVTTASKLAERVEKSIATTSVITQDDIRHIGARNLLDLLRLVSGLGITQSMLGIREIEVRGVKTLFSEKVLIMLNGHPLDHNLQNAGSTWLYDDLPVDTIKRVEVVRGAGSALYGANAFLAIVNIITQTAKDLDGVQFSTGFGSFDTQQYRASWGKQYENTAEAAIHFNYSGTEGIKSPIQQDILTQNGQNSLAPGHSQLHEGRYDLEWHTGYQGFKLDGRYIQKRTGTFAGAAFALSDQSIQNYDNYFFQLSKNWQVTEKFSLDTRAFHDNFSFDNLLQLAPNFFDNSALKNTRNGVEVQGNYQLTDSQMIISGISYSEDQQSDIRDRAGESIAKMMPIPPFGKDRNRARWGIYAQDVWDFFPNLRLTLGARYDEYNDFGGTFNPRLGFNWEFIKDYSLKFSYGTAYRAPAFGELDLMNNPLLSGNPNLSPEKAETFETGVVAHPLPQLTTQAIYYRTDISDIISPISGEKTLLQFANGGRILSEGVELEGRYELDTEFKGSYIAANLVYQTPLFQNAALADVPKIRANLLLNWAFTNHWSIFGHVLFKDATTRMQDDNRASVPSYTLFDINLLGQHFFDKHLDINFSVYNLFDKTYYDPALLTIPGDYQQAGRAYFGHINVSY